MVQSRYSASESETITFESSESFEAPPGTIANYRIEWYLSSIEGNVQVTIGDAAFLVPFSMSNQIRVKVESLPPSECP